MDSKYNYDLKTLRINHSVKQNFDNKSLIKKSKYVKYVYCIIAH